MTVSHSLSHALTFTHALTLFYIFLESSDKFHDWISRLHSEAFGEGYEMADKDHFKGKHSDIITWAYGKGRTGRTSTALVSD